MRCSAADAVTIAGSLALSALVTTLVPARAEGVASRSSAASPSRGGTSASPAPATAGRTSAERAFALTTRNADTANRITSDVPYFVGRHVRLICTVDAMVTDGTLIGQCGKDVEPVDIYVHMATKGHSVGDRFRLLGIVEPPAVWADALGHQVYYPIVRAVFTDPTTIPQ